MFGRKKPRNPKPDTTGRYKVDEVRFEYLTSAMWFNAGEVLESGVVMEDWSRTAAAKAITEFGWAEEPGTISELEFIGQINGWANVAKVMGSSIFSLCLGVPSFGVTAVCSIGNSLEAFYTPEAYLDNLRNDRAVKKRLTGPIESEIIDLPAGPTLHTRHRMNDSFGDARGIVERDQYLIFSPIYEVPVQVLGSWIMLDESKLLREETRKFAESIEIIPKPEHAHTSNQSETTR